MHSVNPHRCSCFFLLTLKNSNHVLSLKHLVLQGEFWSLLYLFQGFLVTGDTGISGDFFKQRYIMLLEVARHMACSSRKEIASLEHLSFLHVLLKGREGNILRACVALSLCHPYLNYALTSPVAQVYQENPLFREQPSASHQRKGYHLPYKSLQGKAIAYCFCSGSTGFNIRSQPGANKFQRHFQALLTAKMVFQILFIFVQMPLGSV